MRLQYVVFGHDTFAACLRCLRDTCGRLSATLIGVKRQIARDAEIQGSWTPGIHNHCIVLPGYHREWGLAGLTTYPRDMVSRFIVANMTEARPNCYYELGIAHALGKEVIHIAREMKDVHFDVNDFNFIVYEHVDDLKGRLRERIQKTIGRF